MPLRPVEPVAVAEVAASGGDSGEQVQWSAEEESGNGNGKVGTGLQSTPEP